MDADARPKTHAKAPEREGGRKKKTGTHALSATHSQPPRAPTIHTSSFFGTGAAFGAPAVAGPVQKAQGKQDNPLHRQWGGRGERAGTRLAAPHIFFFPLPLNMSRLARGLHRACRKGKASASDGYERYVPPSSGCAKVVGLVSMIDTRHGRNQDTKPTTSTTTPHTHTQNGRNGSVSAIYILGLPIIVSRRAAPDNSASLA